MYKLQPCQACGDPPTSRKFAIQAWLDGEICSLFARDLDDFPSLIRSFAAAEDYDLARAEF